MVSKYGVAPATPVVPSYKDANLKYSDLWQMRHGTCKIPRFTTISESRSSKMSYKKKSTKRHDRLEVHPNALLQPLLEKQNNRRLKRRLSIDLKWSRRDLFAGEALILPLEGLIIFVLHHQISPQNVLILNANKKKFFVGDQIFPQDEEYMRNKSW